MRKDNDDDVDDVDDAKVSSLTYIWSDINAYS